MLFFLFVCVITQPDWENAVEHDDEANVSGVVSPPSNVVDEDVELGEVDAKANDEAKANDKAKANDDVPDENTMVCSHCVCMFFCKHDCFCVCNVLCFCYVFSN